MAGTVTFPDDQQLSAHGITKLVINITADASGNANGTHSKVRLNGIHMKSQFVPASGGDAPSTPWACILEDEQGADIYAGKATGLSVSAVTTLCSGVALDDGINVGVIPQAVCDEVEPKVSSLGAGKKAQIVLYLKAAS